MAHGILLLDKPVGLSSNAALQRVRRAYGAARAGHVGSLDPLATGMLPICLGEATKVAGEIVSGRKRYRFIVQLGARTATGDAEGAVVEVAPVPAFQGAGVAAALRRFVGRSFQVPPMYSALKRDGRPLYRLARAGIEVERAAREIEIHSAELLAADPLAGCISVEVCCSKGTYIRVLAEDLARALGTCGHVSALRRLGVEPFDGEPMHGLDALEERSREGRLPALLAPDAALRGLPAVHLDEPEAVRLQQGQAVRRPAAACARRVRLYDADGRFLGLGEVLPEGRVQPRRLLMPLPMVATSGLLVVPGPAE